MVGAETVVLNSVRVVSRLKTGINSFKAYDAFKTIFQAQPAENFHCMLLISIGEDLGTPTIILESPCYGAIQRNFSVKPKQVRV